MKEERNHHLDHEKDTRKNKTVHKEDHERDEMQNIGEVEDKEADLDLNLKEIHAGLEASKK
jgi:hypothetical protein